MYRISDAGQVARVLHEQVLEAASSADDWDPLLARGADDVVHAVGTSVRAAGTDHDGSARIGDQAPVDCVGRHHSNVDARAQAVRGVPERGERGGVIAILRRQVNEY